MKKFLIFILAAFVFAWMIPSGCAVIVPPTGGPKDTIPPVFMGATPPDSSLHFTATDITLNFNEYITVDNPFQNVIVSPITKHTPTITGYLKQVKIKIKDTLEPNTTYSFDFGKSIKDVNEGNIFRHYTYVFSTGDHIDSGSITGTVRLAETGGVDTSLIVVLYNNFSDTAVYKTQPKYYTTILDSNGRFAFHYLPKQKFNLFAVENTYMKDYADSTMLFAFLDTCVNTAQDTLSKNLKLYAFREFPKSEKKSAGSATTSSKKKQKEKEQQSKEPLKVATALDNGQQSLLKHLEITYSKPLKSFDSSKILLTDTNYNKISDYKIGHQPNDTTNTKFSVQVNWMDDSSYKLIIPKEAATDSFDVQLAKDDTISFHVKSKDDYAQVELSFPDIDLSQHPVLQIFSKDDKMVDSIAVGANKKINIAMMEPGEYHFKILYDKNQDMKWTPGNYKKRLQPEIVIDIKNPKSYKVIADTENYIELFINTKAPPKYNPLNL